MNELESSLWFEAYKNDTTSQQGEDGIIEKIFSLIGTQNKFVVECGAANGVKNSNTNSLVFKHGWGALLIEGDPTAFEELQKNYETSVKTTCLNNFVSFEGENTFDNIFQKNDVPKNFDLFILDIDGNEYHVWETIKEYKPRVVAVEFNPTIPNDVDFVQPRDMSIQQGSSLKSITSLGDSLGYRLVALTDFNAFFVLKSCARPFMHLDNTLDLIRSKNEYETKIFQLYDGTIKLSGHKRLIWHKFDIDEQKVQVLPKNKRIYLNGISSSGFVRKLKYRVRKIPIIYPIILNLRKISFFRNVIK